MREINAWLCGTCHYLYLEGKASDERNVNLCCQHGYVLPQKDHKNYRFRKFKLFTL